MFRQIFWQRIQWYLLAVFLFLDLISFGLNRVYGIWSQSALYFLIPDIFLLAFLILNALQWLGTKGFFLFFIWSALLAWGAESYAIIYQPFGRYEFNLESSLQIGLIPVFVLLSWPFFIYVGLQVTNSLLLWNGRNLPNQSRGDWYLIPLLSLLDGFFVTAVDLIIDPIQQYEKLWIWKDGGVFYGVPIGNFIGWFLVTSVSTLAFRIYQYNYEKQLDTKAPSNTLSIPVIIYLIIALFYIYSAYRLEGMDLAIIGGVAMLPLPLWSLYRFYLIYFKVNTK